MFELSLGPVCCQDCIGFINSVCGDYNNPMTIELLRHIKGWFSIDANYKYKQMVRPPPSCTAENNQGMYSGQAHWRSQGSVIHSPHFVTSETVYNLLYCAVRLLHSILFCYCTYIHVYILSGTSIDETFMSISIVFVSRSWHGQLQFMVDSHIIRVIIIMKLGLGL